MSVIPENPVLPKTRVCTCSLLPEVVTRCNWRDGGGQPLLHIGPTVVVREYFVCSRFLGALIRFAGKPTIFLSFLSPALFTGTSRMFKSSFQKILLSKIVK